LNGVFPTAYENILQLKGVGSYTASAIASFAYNLPHAVLDGNVYRVLSRYFGIRIPIDNPEGKKYYSALANELLDKNNPGVYNQSIMDFGATICKPLPLCNICPLNTKCVAYLNGLIQVLPIKEKSIVKKNRWLYYFVAEYKGKFYVRKREQKDIWQNLYEFILIEAPKPVNIKKLEASEKFNSIFTKDQYKIKITSQVYKQQLTHQTINGQFINIALKTPLSLQAYELISPDKIKKLPFPKFITTYLKD
jgi:A/G-specific adenine glycosylase